jgi:hypothetical protein
MGWSCNAAASLTLDAIIAGQKRLGCESSNGIMENGKHVGFWETSRREHADGAITGTVWILTPDGQHCKKAGNFRIEPNGTVTRFARLPRAFLNRAEFEGAAEFRRRYGNAQADQENVMKVENV